MTDARPITGAPWTFPEAVAAHRDASAEQGRVADETLTAYKDHARRERLFRVALARKMLDLKRAGHAITACEVLAKGDPEIADLRFERDVAEALKETAKQAAWRANADRRDVEGLIAWSRARDLAEGYGRGT